MTFILADRVRDTSSSTGTGVFTVSGTAPIPYQTFSAVCTVNDTFPGFIAHQTANEWECGVYTYSASNQITRTVVRSSSNAGSAVSFSAGTKDVVLAPGGYNAWGREVLTGTRTYYVRTGGSDSASHTGRTNVDGDAFATAGYALDRITAEIDLSGFTVIISLQNATWTVPINLTGQWSGGGLIALDFNGSNFAITAGGSANLNFSAAGINAHFQIQNVTISNTTSDLILLSGAVSLNLGAGLTFGAASAGSSEHFYITDGAFLQANSNYSITGSADAHWYLDTGSLVESANNTVTITGTPAFGTAFVVGDMISKIRASGNTFSGAATGSRYSSVKNSVINTFGGGANYFPGNAVGTTGTGGQYA